MATVTVSKNVLNWAVKRSRLTDDALRQSFKKLPSWLNEEAQPTLKQLEKFAKKTHTPIGYFFLPDPPTLSLPITDFRTLRDEALSEPSANLLDTIYMCQQRQDWYRDYIRLNDLGEYLSFIGSVTERDSTETVAQNMRETLEVSIETKRDEDAALRQLITKIESAGILVMVSSVVGNNSHRKLDVGEFRGFALADDLAPLIFLNGADSKSAQMFTLAHELAHLWFGSTGISNAQAGQVPEAKIERWCNKVAAEFLMPVKSLKETYKNGADIPQEIQRLAREFKVSTLVVLRSLFDAGFIDQTKLWEHYRNEENRLRGLKKQGSGGGDFYRSLGARVSKRFELALVCSTLEGQTLFRDALRMLDVSKTSIFNKVACDLGVIT